VDLGFGGVAVRCSHERILGSVVTDTDSGRTLAFSGGFSACAGMALL